MHLAYWSIAQTKNRETEASGMGWELFKNYVISRDKFKPDYFLYENNKSMSPKIREQITQMLGVEPVCINSALVSAQNRQRLYWVGKRNAAGGYDPIPVEQPEDRGILLRDVLESGVCWREKAYTIDANYWKTPGQIGFDTQAGRRKMVAEPVGVGFRNRREDDGRLYRRFETHGEQKSNALTTVQTDSMVAEPIGTTNGGKSYSLTANYSNDPKMINDYVTHVIEKGAKSMVAEPVRVGCLPNADGEVTNSQGKRIYSTDGKARSLLASMSGGNSNESSPSTELYAEPVRVGTIESNAKNADFDSQQYRVYSPDGKSVTLCGNGGGVGAKTGLYAAPVEAPQGMAWRGHAAHGNPSSFEMRKDGKSNAVIVGHQNRLVITSPDGKTLPVYEVRDGQITIKGKQYPIKLRDGCYIIRKLTVTECKRLQTVPEWYVFPVSDSQAYKMLGNGWTVEVIMHLMRHFDGITTEPLDVLSMYDGMACGHIALDNLGADISHYWATEIDKYAIQTATHNFPDIVELGDAFQVRAEDWRII